MRGALISVVAAVLPLTAALAGALQAAPAERLKIRLHSPGDGSRAETISEARLREIMGVCRFEGPLDPVEVLQRRDPEEAFIFGTCDGKQAISREITVAFHFFMEPPQIDVFRRRENIVGVPPAIVQAPPGSKSDN